MKDNGLKEKPLLTSDMLPSILKDLENRYPLLNEEILLQIALEKYRCKGETLALLKESLKSLVKKYDSLGQPMSVFNCTWGWGQW